MGYFRQFKDYLGMEKNISVVLQDQPKLLPVGDLMEGMGWFPSSEIQKWKHLQELNKMPLCLQQSSPPRGV